MNWTIIDNLTQAVEIPGAGCFVRFFGSVNACFAPGLTIKCVETKRTKSYVLAAAPICGTHISFTTDGTASTTGWVGTAGEKLDKKLAALNKKKGIVESDEPQVSIVTFDTPHRGPAKIDRRKFKKVFAKKKK